MDVQLRRRLGAAGLLFIALFIVSGSLVAEKSPHTSATAIAAFYPHHRGALIIEAYLTALAVFVGLGLFWYLRELIGSTPATRRLAGLGFAGVLIFAVGGALSAGLDQTLSDVATHASPAAIQVLNIFDSEVSDVLASAGVAMFLVATGIAVTRGGVLPHWLGWLGVVLGVAALAAVGPAGPIAAVWTLLTSITLLVSSGAPEVDRSATTGTVQAG